VRPIRVSALSAPSSGRVAHDSQEKLIARFVLGFEEDFVDPLASFGIPDRPPARDDGEAVGIVAEPTWVEVVGRRPNTLPIEGKAEVIPIHGTHNVPPSVR
jgi:hypothetical protein